MATGKRRRKTSSKKAAARPRHAREELDAYAKKVLEQGGITYERLEFVTDHHESCDALYYVWLNSKSARTLALELPDEVKEAAAAARTADEVEEAELLDVDEEPEEFDSEAPGDDAEKPVEGESDELAA